MPQVLYDAHPSLLRTRPFGTLLTILLMLGGILVAVVGDQVIPPEFKPQIRLDGRTLQMIGIGVFAFFTLQLLTGGSRPSPIISRSRADEILWTHGLLSKQYTEIQMASVRTVRVTQTLFQRLMNAGDITIYTAGDTPELVVRGLPDPGEIRELIKAQPASGA
jgi:hypothetical protein